MDYAYEQCDRPQIVDRLIFHQFDPLRSSAGGIDTCLRGFARYAPRETTIAIVGVDATQESSPQRIGHWEKHRFGDRDIFFMPVASLDPGNQLRRIPHSLRLVAGLIRHRRSIPHFKRIQAHRMDLALTGRLFLRAPLEYIIHTQQGGISAKTSDSIWRYAGPLHHYLEKVAISQAVSVIVFHRDYARKVQRWNKAARFSPTWFDPMLVNGAAEEGRTPDPHSIVWVSRVETPKDPLLAIKSFTLLVASDRSIPWRLDIMGAGTLLESVRRAVLDLEPDIARRITVHGRVEASQVALTMSSGGIFLMTSQPGYEGFPLVLVEALAAGVPAVVTEGSDPGNIISNGKNGFVTDRDPENIVARLRDALSIERSNIAVTVSEFQAPVVIRRIFDLLGHPA